MTAGAPLSECHNGSGTLGDQVRGPVEVFSPKPDGSEVMRVVSGDPQYWKARNLDTFNGRAWQGRARAVPD